MTSCDSNEPSGGAFVDVELTGDVRRSPPRVAVGSEELNHGVEAWVVGVRMSFV
jgi:hypothetical protein